MNTTGNPAAGDADPAAPGTPNAGPSNEGDASTQPVSTQPGRQASAEHGTDQHGTDQHDSDRDAPGHPADPAGYAGDPLGEYGGYSGGYGYGPGYGDPDGGVGYSYGPGYAAPGGAEPGPAYAGAGQPGPAGQGGYPPPGGPGEWPGQAGGPSGRGTPAAGHGAPPGPGQSHDAADGAPAPYQPALPVVASTPALKGYPGGPGLDEAEDEVSPGSREARVLSSPSVWQSAQKAWRDSGVEWQRSVTDHEPAEAEFERIHSAPHSKRRTTTRAAASGQLSTRSAGALSATLARESAGGAPKSSGGGGGFHIGRGVWLTALVIIVVAGLVAGGLVLFGKHNKPRPKAGPQYPPATPAAADFTSSGPAGRGIFQGVTGVAASGSTVVAIGAETGQWLPRAQFLVSTDGGHSWRLAAQRSATGAQPTPGFQPELITHGPRGWLAIGQGALWTSPDGQTWTLGSVRGVSPMSPGDQVIALAGTGTGFIAVGVNVPTGKSGHRTPVLWTSPNGQTWQRLTGSGLKLTVAGGRVLQLSHVAASGANVVVSGSAQVTHRTVTHRRHRKVTHVTTSVVNVVWYSANDGASWTHAHLPAQKDVSGKVTGLAPAGTGFVAISPGSSKSAGPDVAAYTSATGASWANGGKITASKSAKLSITMLGGSDQGVVATGLVSGGHYVAYESSHGQAWHSLPSPGNSAQILTEATVTTGGTVVAAGATTPTSVAQAPYLALATAGQPLRPVSFAQVAGAVGPSLRIGAIATAGGQQLAVGAANGLAAIWSAPAGMHAHWSAASSPALNRPGLSVLNGVAHGPSGWVAVGSTVADAPVHPIVVGSASGTNWQAADSESAFSGSGITLHAVTAGPSGYVAVGQQDFPAKTTTKTTGHGKHKKTVKHVTPAHTAAAAWYSSGLTGWKRATFGQDATAGPQQITAVTAGRSGFVAVGSVGKSPAAWTSANGQTWQPVRLGPPTGATAETLQSVAARGGLIVATGMAATPAGSEPYADYSTDGGTIWQQEKLTARGGPAVVTTLTATTKGFVATGAAGQPGNQRVVLWWSTGGFSWKPIEPTGTGMNSSGVQQITALTAAGSALTGVGYQASTAGQQPTLWHATAGP